MAFISFTFFISFIIILSSLQTNHAFRFESFDKDSTFSSQISLHGDAKIVDSALVSTNGSVVYKTPIRFLGTSPGFSTDFSFSVPESHEAQALAFFIGDRVLSVELGDRVRINIGTEVKGESSNLSSFGGRKMRSLIDYNGFSKLLKVRLNGVAVISYRVDLSNILWREAMVVGLSSTGLSTIYSWRFVAKHGAPYLMHSEPLDPNSILVRSDEDHTARVGKTHFSWGIIVAAVIGAAFGGLVVFVAFVLRSSVVKRHPVAPVEFTVGTASEKVGLAGRKVEGGM